MDFISKVIELFSTPKYMESIFEGLKMTLIISVLAAILGLFIGVVVALISIADNSPIMVIPKAICKLYITIIRGTPMALQLFIMFYVIFTFRGFPEAITATIAFGVNSGAYVAENIRAGILSVDIGQTEAARSLGLNSTQTMIHIVIPQAVKNILPALCNEFIAIVKETSLASTFFIGELMTQFKTINGITYRVLEPLTIVGIIYFLLTFILSKLIALLERRLNASER